jgi:hypothetical protein
MGRLAIKWSSAVKIAILADPGPKPSMSSTGREEGVELPTSFQGRFSVKSGERFGDCSVTRSRSNDSVLFKKINKINARSGFVVSYTNQNLQTGAIQARHTLSSPRG